MKRIISILAVVCLVVAMAVPTFASSEVATNYTPKADIVLNDFVSVVGVYEVQWESGNKTGDTIEFKRYLVTTEYAEYYQYFVYFKNGSTNVMYWLFDFNGKRQSNYDAVVIYNPSTDLSTAMAVVAIGECDGSTCSVADFDMNEICDTCGMPLAYSVQRSYTPDGWPSEYPAMPVGADGNSQYILMTKDDGYTYLYIFTPYEASPVSEWNTVGSVHASMQLKMFDDSGNGVNVKRLTYRLSDDGDWYQHDSQSVDSTLFGSFDEIDMIYSTLSFYKEDGTLFFPLPLWAEMDKVTQGELPNLVQMTDGTITTLVLCGVGLMALLLVLKLFGKRSLIYRG